MRTDGRTYTDYSCKLFSWLAIRGKWDEQSQLWDCSSHIRWDCSSQSFSPIQIHAGLFVPQKWDCSSQKWDEQSRANRPGVNSHWDEQSRSPSVYYQPTTTTDWGQNVPRSKRTLAKGSKTYPCVGSKTYPTSGQKRTHGRVKTYP